MNDKIENIKHPLFRHLTGKDHTQFMFAAQNMCRTSHDPKTQTGAVVVAVERMQFGDELLKRIIGRGSNTVPFELTDEIKNRFTANNMENQDRYNLLVHAEENAITDSLSNNLSTHKLDRALYLPWYPCVNCAKTIANSGIKFLVHSTVSYDDPKYNFDAAREVIKLAGVEEFLFLPGDIPFKLSNYQYQSQHYADYYKSNAFQNFINKTK